MSGSLNIRRLSFAFASLSLTMLSMNWQASQTCCFFSFGRWASLSFSICCSRSGGRYLRSASVTSLYSNESNFFYVSGAFFWASLRFSVLLWLLLAPCDSTMFMCRALLWLTTLMGPAALSIDLLNCKESPERTLSRS